MSLEIDVALYYFQELPLCILCKADGFALEHIYKQINGLYGTNEKTQNPYTMAMREAINRLKQETGKESFSIEEVQKKMIKDNL